jgi:hypothetical protein
MKELNVSVSERLALAGLRWAAFGDSALARRAMSANAAMMSFGPPVIQHVGEIVGGFPL